MLSFSRLDVFLKFKNWTKKFSNLNVGPNGNGFVGNSSNRLAVASVKTESAQFLITIDRG